jgi:hypothetical protein
LLGKAVQFTGDPMGYEAHDKRQEKKTEHLSHHIDKSEKSRPNKNYPIGPGKF